MKSVGKSLFLSLLLSLGIMAALNMESVKASSEKVNTIAVAAGDVPLEDPSSPDPLTHCYDVATADQLDIKTRMDFEARTSAGWVASDAVPGKLCVVETDAAVAKRLSKQEQ